MPRCRQRLPALIVLAVLGSGWTAVPAAAAPRRNPGPAKPTGPPLKRAASVRKTPSARKAPAPPVLLGLRMYPQSVALRGPGAERQLVVTGRFSDGTERDMTGHVRYVSLAPAARVSPGGLVTAAADGAASVKAVAGKVATMAQLSVSETAQETRRSFHDEVIPVLTRAGCNMGACHGAQHGKGGFKLSLLGFDPDSDFNTIVRQGGGRRVARSEPAESLLLKKATLAVPHAGGMRFGPKSHEYGLIVRWLADGLPAPDPKEPLPAKLEVYPPKRVVHLKGGQPDQPDPVAIPQVKGAPKVVRLPRAVRLAAEVTFKDGSTQDVTRKAQFNTLNDGIAAADADGRVEVLGRGETAVMVRYRGLATVAQVTVPFRELKTFPETPQANYIDALAAAKWREMGLIPSPRSGDAEFIRRVYGDALGILPAPEEVRAFLASTDPKKREKLVDAVLQRPEYVDYWTLKWGDLLRNNRDRLGDKGMWSFYNWLRASFRENKPADRFARELVTAQGSTYTTGPANFFRVANNPADQSEQTAQVFLGVRLACAKCHHHPFEKWTQDEYWQMAAFFARVGLKGSQEFGIFGGEQVVRLNPSGEVSNPRTGQRMAPTPLDGEPADDPVDRRRVLASWMTAPENPFFARNIVNRYWGYLMGRGIVEPIDDLRVTNPPSNPELLDALARDFVAHKFDVKHLLRTIMTSETYALSSTPTPDNRQDEVFYTKYAAKRMGAEELLDAVNFATGTQDKFPNLPAGMRAVQLPDPKVQNYFLDTFGRPERAILCECERSAEPNMAQALHLMNSDYIQNKVAAKDGRLAKLLEAKKPDPEIVEELYLVTFSRLPTPAEAAKALEIAATAPSKKEGFEDLLWALLNSREFLFKH